jgi:cellulose synthase/poly-beta-1,6-N-acetylglucosamine synthase-like glycosyltransferase
VDLAANQALGHVQSGVLVIYYILLFLLTIYGTHRYILLYLYRKHRDHREKDRREYAEGHVHPEQAYPSVTVQLPIFNEMYVTERVIRAAAHMNYPADKLTVQVLDDSTDETRTIAQNVVRDLRDEGYNVIYHHRTERVGFKAGALQEGLHLSDTELYCIFDADFVPPKDFLKKAVPYFTDQSIGVVQAKWGHINEDYSLLTRAQSIMLDGHFQLEHGARNISGRFMNFNGTAGIIRRQAILDAGGWQHDTLTEDLDLSYRMQLKGWKFKYVPRLVCPSELPVDVNGFMSQQYRWTKGSVQVGCKMLKKVFMSKIPWRLKCESVMHLLSPVNYLLLFLISIIIPFAVYFRQQVHGVHLGFIEVVFFILSFCSIGLFYTISLKETYGNWRQRLAYIPFVFSTGVGMCLNNGRAVLGAFLAKSTPFIRTPKYNICTKGEKVTGKRYTLSRIAYGELLLALYLSTAFVFFVATGNYFVLPFLSIFVFGYCYIAFLSFKR